MRSRRDPWRRAGFILVFCWFALGGAAHLAMARVFVAVVPAYVPYPRTVVWATGLCEIAGALALFSGRLRPAAGLALCAFCICVLPVHIEMLHHAERYPALGAPLLWFRLLMQPVLIAIIWAVIQPELAHGA